MKSLRAAGWSLLMVALVVAVAAPLLVTHGIIAAEPLIVIDLALLLTGIIVLRV